jgi:hypothetical protein
MSLSRNQYKLLSNFFNDIAKGYLLGIAAGQAFISDINLKVIYTFVWFLIALLYLGLALVCVKRTKQDEN